MSGSTRPLPSVYSPACFSGTELVWQWISPGLKTWAERRPHIREFREYLIGQHPLILYDTNYLPESNWIDSEFDFLSILDIINTLKPSHDMGSQARGPQQNHMRARPSSISAGKHYTTFFFKRQPSAHDFYFLCPERMTIKDQGVRPRVRKKGDFWVVRGAICYRSAVCLGYVKSS
jgi:hypothetical protein